MTQRAAQLDEALRGVAARRETSLMAVTIAAPCGLAASLLRLFPEEHRFWWQQSSSAMSAVGVVERFSDLPTPLHAHHRPVGAPRIRYVGALPFDARVDPAWGRLLDAGFVLPRYQYVEERGAAWLTRSAHTGTVNSDAVREELQVLLSALRELGEVSHELPRLGRAHGETAAQVDYVALVDAALRRIRSGGVHKIVVHRQLELVARELFDESTVVERIRRQLGPHTGFLLGSAQTGSPQATPDSSAAFVGASPERLVRKTGTAIATEALAGTVRSDGSGVFGDKERREQAYVVEAIKSGLSPLCSSIAIEDAIARTAGHASHLCSTIAGTSLPNVHVLDVVRALHPTPAVAGTPTAVALAWLAEHEPVARGLYAGPVGWFDAAGDGEFAVALRCARLSGKRITLFVGAGIVEGSDPESEYRETLLKQAVMMQALGVLDE